MRAFLATHHSSYRYKKKQLHERESLLLHRFENLTIDLPVKCSKCSASYCDHLYVQLPCCTDYLSPCLTKCLKNLKDSAGCLPCEFIYCFLLIIPHPFSPLHTRNRHWQAQAQQGDAEVTFLQVHQLNCALAGPTHRFVHGEGPHV